MNIFDLIRPPQIKIKPDSASVIDNNKKISFTELESLIRKTSYGFIKMGIKENDLVTLLFENGSHFIIAVLSLWQIGAIPVPLNNKLLKENLIEQIDFLKPNITLKSEKFNDVSLINDVTIVVDNFSNKEIETSLNNFSNDKTAIILFTSGSSGKPKAVILSFKNLIQSALTGNKVLKHTTADKWLASLPFYHIGGFSIIFRALLFGASVIIPDSLSNDNLAKTINKYKPTLASLVSNQLKKFVDNNFIPPEELRMVLIGGGFSDKELILKTIDKSWKIAKVYGSTETSSFVSFMNTEEIKSNPGASGRAIEPNKIIITNEGEIVLQSPAVMRGYFNNEEETSFKLRDGFYFTGDLGYLDNKGYLFVEAKRSDLIISGGENINPVEVENEILSHPKVNEVCVVGLEDNKWGQIITAAVVLKGNNILSENELKDFLRDKLASFKIPKKIKFVNQLPKSDLGKMQREKIRMMLEESF